MDNIGAIVLAAGASTRMKRQKMLLPYYGKTVIETVIDNVLNSVKNVVVILGSHKNEIYRQIRKLPVKISVNKNYLGGMLSSAICGFKSLPDKTEAALIVLGDQPQISGNVINTVIEAWKSSGKGIIIPTYNGRRGHPSLIETKYRNEIEALDPEKGLRSLFQKFENDIFEIECNFPEILRDIDTPEDYTYETNIKQRI